MVFMRGNALRGLRRRAISPESGFFRTGVHALLTGYLVGLQLVLVANDLAIQFVHQIINGGIHVLVAAFGVHIASLYPQGAFCAWPTFRFLLIVDAQQDTSSHDPVKMTRNPL